MVGQLFTALTAGFSRFVLAWLIPSIATLALFSLFLFGALDEGHRLGPVGRVAAKGLLDRSLMFGFAGIVLALVSALGSRPLYRLLEGYTGPAAVRRVLLRRQTRHFHRLRRQLRATPRRHVIRRGLLREELADYPRDPQDLLPTRLGNAFRALETYGQTRFGLDSQALWYELHAVAPDRLRQDIEDARASVDFFVGFVGQLVLLAVLGLLTASVTRGSPLPALLLCGACLALARGSYNAAVRNMSDFRYAVQALVNTARPALGESLGYRLPSTAEQERALWRTWSGYVRGDQRYLSPIDSARRAVDGPSPAA